MKHELHIQQKKTKEYICDAGHTEPSTLDHLKHETWAPRKISTETQKKAVAELVEEEIGSALTGYTIPGGICSFYDMMIYEFGLKPKTLQMLKLQACITIFGSV